MNTTRKIDIYTAGCSICDQTEEMVRSIACSDCTIEVHNINQKEAAEKAESLGIRSIPAIVINGELASCCVNSTRNAETLKSLGIGQPLSN